MLVQAAGAGGTLRLPDDATVLGLPVRDRRLSSLGDAGAGEGDSARDQEDAGARGQEDAGTARLLAQV